jgi:ATP-dependent RNA helicase DDX51/DBP6
MIVSATLTKDPAKLSRLQLHCPRYVALTAVGSRYSLPAALKQWRLLTPGQHKPLALMGLLQQLEGQRVLVFASSLETTHRWGGGGRR